MDKFNRTKVVNENKEESIDEKEIVDLFWESDENLSLSIRLEDILKYVNLFIVPVFQRKFKWKRLWLWSYWLSNSDLPQRY